ncbi:hypothetical protein IL306_003230 [Fusarium sp. DS 682]|nr:hypothetical protein IL306_003230 [Fusarium sp. DS 682]
MSGLTVDQREVIRGRRTVGRSTAGHPPQGSNAGERSDDDTSIVGDNTPGTSQESPGSAQSNTSTALSKKFKLHIHGPDVGLTALATLNNPWPNTEWGSKKVADLRHIFAPHVTNEHDFCLGDKSLVPEDVLVADYFEETIPTLEPKEKTAVDGDDAEKSVSLLETSSLKPPPRNVIYVKAKPAAEAIKATAVDAFKKAFMIKFIDKTRETSTGSIQSSDLSADMSTVQLGALRPFINMSSDHSRHEFCLGDGTSVSDSMLLKTYISKGDVPNGIDSDLPILTVYFQKVGRKSIFAEASEEMKNLGKVDTKTDLTFDPGNGKPVMSQDMASKAADLSKQGFQESFLSSLADVKATKYLTPAELDEMQWDTVLGNCNVMYGWKFDLNTMSVKRAPQPAFQLRKGLNLTKESDMKPIEENKPPKAEVVKATTNAEGGKTETKDGGENGEEGGEEGGGEEGKEEDEKPKPANGFISKRKKPIALPNFCVVDDSKIEISLVRSTLEESMAKNNFTASSFEVGGSANIKGVDIGASGGAGKRDDQGVGNRSTTIETLMIGNYRFPRASVFLRAEDLEPTEGLAAAIEKVRLTKSLDHLKDLYDKYGHFFCEEVLIGGRSNLLADKFAQLDLSPELGLRFLAGTSDPFPTRGSAGYLLPRKSDATAQEASVVYTETTQHETLSLAHEELPGIIDPDALQTEGATHVIVGVWWGGRVAVTASRPSSPSIISEGSNEAEFPLSTVVDSIGRLFVGKPVDSDAKLEEAAKNLNFQVNTDIDPDKKASGVSSLGAIQEFNTALPAAWKKVKMGKGVPIAYDIIPIKDFANAVSQQLIDEPRLPTFEDLYTAKQVLNDYIYALSQHELSVPKTHLSDTKQSFSNFAEFEDSLRQSLSQDLSRARDETNSEALRLSNPSWTN